MKVDDNTDLPSGVSIGQKMVDEFIAYTETKTMGTKTTVVRCVLRNGFEIVESTGCVDEKNYSEKIGYEICMGKIKDKIWELLGFLLQTAWKGIQEEGRNESNVLTADCGQKGRRNGKNKRKGSQSTERKRV